MSTETSVAEDIGIRRPQAVTRSVLLRVTLSVIMPIRGGDTDEAAIKAAIEEIPRCLRIQDSNATRPIYRGARLVESRVLAPGELPPPESAG